MDVKETFGNVYISDGGRGITVYKRTPGGGIGDRLGTFKHDEYDVEISFKSKPRPIAPGDLVQVVCETTGPYTVLAVYDDPEGWENGSWAWIYDKGVMPPRSVLMCNLRRVEPIK